MRRRTLVRAPSPLAVLVAAVWLHKRRARHHGRMDARQAAGQNFGMEVAAVEVLRRRGRHKAAVLYVATRRLPAAHEKTGG